MDANGILTATATHEGTGRKEAITIDAKTSGRLTTDEITKLVEKAENMKILDEKEENRVAALKRVEILCNHVKLDAQRLPQETVKELLVKVNECMEWAEKNQNASEEDSKLKYEALHKCVTTIMPKIRDEGPGRSQHTSRMNKVTAAYCLSEGEKLLEAGTKEDLNEALAVLGKAYMLGKEKHQRFHMAKANILMGHIHRLLACSENDPTQFSGLCVQASARLASGLELDKGKSLSREARATAVTDMKLVAELFFRRINDLGEVERFKYMEHFMRPLENDKYIKDQTWKKLIFTCCTKEMKIYLTKVKMLLQEDDFKSALGFISGQLEPAQQQASRLTCSKEDVNQLSKIKKDIQEVTSSAAGKKRLNLARASLEADHDDVDRALFALDHLSEVKRQTREGDFKTFAEGMLLEGQIYLSYVKNDNKAKGCFETIVKDPRAKEQADVYTEAKFHLEKLEAEEEQSKKQDPSKESLKEALKAELDKLDQADMSKTNEAFISFLFSTFPPKHKQGAKKPEVNAKSPLKKAYFRLSAFYHPDKVDTDIHGKEHQVLCEEISKRVNARFSKM